MYRIEEEELAIRDPRQKPRAGDVLLKGSHPIHIGKVDGDQIYENGVWTPYSIYRDAWVLALEGRPLTPEQNCVLNGVQEETTVLDAEVMVAFADVLSVAESFVKCGADSFHDEIIQRANTIYKRLQETIK